KIRSLLYFIGVTPLTIIFSAISIIILPLPRRLRYQVVIQWSRCALWWLNVTCGLRHEIHGSTNIPEQAGVIFCKHQSAWETMSMQFIFPPHAQVLKRELFWIPFFGWGLWSLNPIAIDRSAGAKAMRQVLKQGKERIADGWWILLFPEGTRTPPGAPSEYSPSGAALAKRANCPLVPVAHNAGEFWSRNAFEKRPGVIQVIIGKPIETADKSATEITDEAKSWIEARCAEITKL
ncbi:MAG: lysophospholipid acyltransferase family protein, partial [Pseudomonadota bacterium]